MQLIQIKPNTIGNEVKETVNARELHSFLGVKSEFRNWIKNRIADFDFTEDQDFTVVGKNLPGTATEYFISLDMAKELSMVERNDKGKQARQYFIECEKKAKASVHYLIPKSLPEALRLAANLAEENERQKEIIHELEPKANFHDAVTEAINCHTVQEVAKVLGTGEIRLFRWLRENGMLMQDNQPYQDHIEAKHFKRVQKQYKDKRGESVTYQQTLITGLGLAYIQKRFSKEAA